MTSRSIDIQHHVLYPNGFFRKHPALFDTYYRNTPASQHDGLEDKKAALRAYEGTVCWPVIRGPGFCGATHPGAGKTFNGRMTDGPPSIYNSDCLYVHPGRNIFAVSDPPGITRTSRTLFEKLDASIKKTPSDMLPVLINRLASGIPANRQPTLALIHIGYHEKSGNAPWADVFLAGDTDVYRGNFKSDALEQVNGSPYFWGNTRLDLRPQRVHLEADDFFLVVSDGIHSLRQTHPGEDIEGILWNHTRRDPEKCAQRLVSACNRVFVEKNGNGPDRTLLGGTDDITVLFIVPGELSPTFATGGYILGGTIHDPAVP